MLSIKSSFETDLAVDAHGSLSVWHEFSSFEAHQTQPAALLHDGIDVNEGQLDYAKGWVKNKEIEYEMRQKQILLAK